MFVYVFNKPYDKTKFPEHNKNRGQDLSALTLGKKPMAISP